MVSLPEKIEIALDRNAKRTLEELGREIKAFRRTADRLNQTIARQLPHTSPSEGLPPEEWTDGPYTVIGPECFTDGDVISYKGENFYRACGADVTYVSGSLEVQSTCVKRINHPGYYHEDYDGNLKVGIR